MEHSIRVRIPSLNTLCVDDRPVALDDAMVVFANASTLAMPPGRHLGNHQRRPWRVASIIRHPHWIDARIE